MHNAPLAVLALVAVCELIGAALVVTLVAMTDRKDRARAIRAAAAVLAALLPWRSREPVSRSCLLCRPDCGSGPRQHGDRESRAQSPGRPANRLRARDSRDPGLWLRPRQPSAHSRDSLCSPARGRLEASSRG